MKQPTRGPKLTHRGILACGLALLCLLVLTLPTLAEPASSRIYMPIAMKAGSATQPTPTPVPSPQPTSLPTPEQPHNGFFAMRDWLTYNAATAVDARGGIHLAFYQSDEGHDSNKLGQVAFYAYCPGPSAACTDGSKWTAVQFSSTGVNEVQIVLTTDGRPRLLIRRNGSVGYDYEYWACEQQCTNAGNWAGLDVTQAAGSDIYGTDQPQHSFALDSQNRPRFIWSNGWGNGRLTGIYYAHCDAADCTQPGSWTQAIVETLDTITVTADNSTLVFDGDKPRVLTRANYSGLPKGVEYMECNRNCDYEFDWDIVDLPQLDNKMWASWDLALDANGHPRIALYQPADPGLTVGGKLFYGWCDSDCINRPPNFQLVQVASGEGKNVDMAIDQQGRTHMVYDAGDRGTLAERWCDTTCTDANMWQGRILETSAQLMQEFAPSSPLSCDQEQEDRVWMDAISQVAFDPSGRLVVAYDTTNYARCYYVDPAHPGDPVYTRIERVWWAVRWANFAQP